MATCLCALTQGRGQLLQPQAKTLVRLPERGGHWTIQFKPRTSTRPAPVPGTNGEQVQTAGPATMKSVDVVSSGDVRRDRIQMSDGITTEVWKIKGEWFFPVRKDEIRSMNVYHGANIYPGWKKFEDGELQQLAKSGTGTPTVYRNMPVMYYGSVSIENHLSFIMDINNLTNNYRPSAIKTAVGLFVDPETLFPIVYRDPSGDYVFNNITEGPQNLEVPAKYAFIAKSSQDMSYVPKPPTSP